MKISFNWLKDYIKTDKSHQEVAGLLTDCGLEVESFDVFQSVKGGLEGIVIGEVLTKEKHPDADKLSLTTVNVGDNKILNIVCGAPNVEAGQKVLVATIGTTIYKGEESFVIKKSKIRGSLSEGMICAEDELGLGNSHAGIMVLDSSAPIGMPAKQYLNISDDIVFEIGLTPNRPDATSHFGVARDLNAVLTAISYQQSAISNKTNLKINLPDIENFKIDNTSNTIEVKIEDKEACPRYSGLTVSDFVVKDSPDWMKNRLKAIGLRPINNIVDITNYVMMETGQPLHAFDIDKIKGRKVIVKKLAKGTKFTTLDEVERELTENDLMICNAEEGMCIAGVFGGLDSGITENTKALFLESAHFSPQSVRRTAKYHGLSTDSSFRFERSADPNITVYSLKRAALLIKELAGGQISSEVVDIYPEPIQNSVINVSVDNICKLIGKTIDKNIITTIIESLGIKILSDKDSQLTLSVPPFKSDVKREADIVEEVLRIYGYNNVELPEDVRLSLNYSEKPDRAKLQNIVSDYLSNNSFFEIYCNSLTRAIYTETFSSINPENNVIVLNPISKELNVMRQSLLFGGLETIVHNYNRKQHNLKLYEFGNTYHFNKFGVGSSELVDNKKEFKLSQYSENSHLSVFMTGNLNNETWNTTNENTDIYDIKFHIHNLLTYTGINSVKLNAEKISDDIFANGLIYKADDNSELLRFGLLNKKVLQLFDIKSDVLYCDINWEKVVSLSENNKPKYKELSKYPEVRRDIAMLIDKSIQYADIEKIAFQTEKKLLKMVDLFDFYEGEKIDKNKKSYAISLILQDNEKTLTDTEVDKVINKIRSAITEKLNAIIR